MRADTTPDAPWQLPPVSARTRLWLLALTALLPIAITAIALAFAASSEGPRRLINDSLSLTIVLTMIGLTALTGAICWVIDRALRRHRLSVDTHGLEIATTFHRRQLGWNELQLAQARVVDLDERTELKPLLRTNGTALPGLQSGWFRLRNHNKALVARTGGHRVLWLPTTRGYDLLLQPRQPQALLQHLQALAPAHPRG